MRISDWSSDVCSSDLIDGEAPASGGGGGAGAPVTDTTIEGIGTATTFTRIAGPIKVTVGTSGEVELARSEEHTSELQSLMRISYAVFCLKTKKADKHRSKQHDVHTQAPYNNLTER